LVLRCLSKPREGGVYGVWTASFVFGLMSVSYYNASVGLAIAAGLITLLLSDPQRFNPLCLSIPVILYAPIIIGGLPYSILAILVFPPLYYVTLHGGVLRNVSGAGMVALPGGLLALASGEPGLILLPVSYGIMASSFAYRRIYRSQPMMLDYGSVASIILYSLSLFYNGIVLGGAILLIDLSLRVTLRVSGLDYRMGLRTYGFLEAFRSLTVMTLTGLGVRYGI